MDFQVLGPLRAVDGDDEVELGGPKQRLVLAMLLAAHGATVSTDALAEGLWMESAPATARKTLQGYIHHLRQRIGEGLETDRAGGYALRVGEHHVDERVFSRMVQETRPLVAAGPGEAAERLGEALAMWHGSPYAGLDDSPVLLAEISRLSEMRLVALGDRIEADLALGRHDMLIGELESLTVDFPLHERFRGLLMLALHRSGRHGEALRAFSRARDYFVDEMGLEPSAQLIDLERRLLERDPSLDAPVEEVGGIERAVRGYELRERAIADPDGDLYRGYQRSVGREVAIRVIGPPLADDPGFIARYRADIARVAQLDHPQIIGVQDTWREPGRAYQVMRWVDGERLDVRLERDRLSDWDALRILTQVGAALDAAHRGGVVHGDVRAATVLCASTDHAYLTDFVVGRANGTVADDLDAFRRLAIHSLFGVEVRCDAEVDDLLTEAIAKPELLGVFSRDEVIAAASASDLVDALRRALGGAVVGLADDSTTAAERTERRCPYKGLQAFGSADAADYFGRDTLVDRLHDRFAKHRLVAVVGPSGSGKSSVVRAGLVPRLADGPRPAVICEMFPGPYPFDSLERALRSIAVDDVAIGDLLRDDHRGLGRTIDEVLPGGDVELVLVIDQFEELFASGVPEVVCSGFLDALVAAVSRDDSRLRVLLTLRADFFDRPLRYAEFGSLVEAGLVPVGMPDVSELAAAIEGPAAAVGVRLEPGLVNEIVSDVADGPGGLPLLQYAMTELFERRRSDVLTLEEYQASGRALGALAQRAESLFAELGERGRTAMHQALLRMVSIEDGAHVRRRVARSELRALEVDQAALDDGLRRFGAHRLLTFDSDPVSRAPTVEVAHESLIREWDRLRRWVEGESEQLVVRRRLAAARQEWAEAGEDSAYLLGGRRLAQFDDWASRTDMALSSDERAFLERSRAHDEARLRTQSRRRRRAGVTLVAVAVVAVMFGVYALVLRERSADEAFAAETARLGSEAGFVVEHDRQLALLMAAETYRRDPGVAGLSALQRVLVDSGPYLANLGAGHAYEDAAWLTDEQVLAVGDAEVHLINATTGHVEVLPIDVDDQLGRSPLLGASSVGFAAVAGVGGRVLLVEGESGDIAPFSPATDSSAIAISTDGSIIAAGFEDGRIDLIDRASGDVIASTLGNPPRTPDDVELPTGATLDPALGGDIRGVDALRFDSETNVLVSAGGIFIRAWDATDLTPRGPEILHAWGADDFNLVAAAPSSMWIDPLDPAIVVTAGSSFVARWKFTDGTRSSLQSVAAQLVDATPVGASTLLLADDGVVVRRSLTSVAALDSSFAAGADFVFDTQERVVSTLAIDDAGTRLGVSTDDGVVVAALDGTRLLAQAVPIGSSEQPTISSDGQVLAPGRADDGLLDLAVDPPERTIFDVDVEIAQHAGSPATLELVDAGPDSAVLWTSPFMEMRNAYDLAEGAYLGDFWGAYRPAWSDDGRWVARRPRSGGTMIEDSESDIEFSTDRPMLVADFDRTGAQVVIVFADQDPPVIVDLTTLEARPLDGPDGIVAAAFAPDGGEIVAIIDGGSIRAFDAETLDPAREFEGLDGTVGEIVAPPVFDPTGELMYADADGSARVWHLASGRLIGKSFPSEPGGVPSGRAGTTELRIVTPHDELALLWNLRVDDWAQIACRAAGRNMTEAESSSVGSKPAEYRETCPGLERGV